MKLLHATFYNAVAKYSTMIVQLGVSMILARIIAPDDFGIIGIVYIIIGFFTLFTDMGLGISVIQFKEMDEKKQNLLFTFSVKIGILLMAIICVSSYPVSIIYKNDIYIKLCPIISIIALINSANVVPNSILIRDKEFKIIALRTFISACVSGAIAVILAKVGWGVYALVIQSIVNALAIFAWNYMAHPLKLIKSPTREVVNILGTYSLFQFLFSILNYFTRNLDSLFIGKKWGDSALGHYNKAYSTNLYPNMIFTSVVTGVLHPYLRDMKDNYGDLKECLFKILRVLAYAGIVVTVVFFSCSSEIIRIMYGPNWDSAAKCFNYLSICVWAQILSSVSGSVFLALERTDQTFKCGIINLLFIGISLFVGWLFDSYYILALAVGISYIFIFFITYYLLINRTMNQKYITFIFPFFSDLVVIGVILLIFKEFTYSLSGFLRIVVNLIISLVITSLYYMIPLNRDSISFFFNRIKR